MKNIAALALVMSFACSLATITQAEARPYWKTRVNQRQCHQQKRLYQGASTGSLNGREYRRIQAREANLAATEARYRRSGNGLTPAEAAKLERRQDNLSHDIYQQKHDAQTQGQ